MNDVESRNGAGEGRHPLWRRIGAVSQRARFLIRFQATARSLAAVLAVGLVLGALDAVLRGREPFWRWGSFLVVAATAAWTCWRWLRPAIRFHLTDIETAQRVERHYPPLRGLLASAIEFLQGPAGGQSNARATAADDVHSPSPGESLALRQAAIAMATAVSSRLNLGECLDSKPAQRAFLTAVGVTGLLVAAAVLSPAQTLLAARRLALPWSRADWPQRFLLEFETLPDRLPAGADLDFVVRDARGNALPELLTLHYQFDGEAAPQQRLLRAMGTQCAERILHVGRTVRLRLDGGDDRSMPWHTVEVRPSARVESFEIEFVPPAYSGIPHAIAMPPLVALQNTRVAVSGRVERPLDAAELIHDTGHAEPIQLELIQGGLAFRTAGVGAWELERSGSYELAFKDQDGFPGGREIRGEIQVLPDRPPELHWDGPSGPLSASPNATISLWAAARDDLAVRDVVARIERAEASAAESPEELFRREAPPALERFPRPDGGDRVALELRLELQRYPDLRPGETLDVTLVATDFLDQVAEGQPLRIRIVAPDTLFEQLVQRNAQIVTQLTEAARAEGEARRRTDEALSQSSQQAHETAAELTRVAQHSQQRVRHLLSDPTEGALAKVDQLLSELTTNKLERNSLSVQLAELRDELHRLGTTALPEADESLAQAEKRLRQQPPREPESVLRSAMHSQDAVLSALHSLLKQLSDWESIQRLAAEARRIERLHQQVTDATRRLLEVDQSFRALSELSDTERADVAQLARQQFDVGHDLDRLLNRMRDALPQQTQRDPAAGQALEAGLRAAEEADLSFQIRGSGSSLERNRLGEASAVQQEIQDGLRDFAAAVSQQPERDLGRAIEAMRQAAERAREIAQEQNALAREFEKVAERTDPEPAQRAARELASRQQELAHAAQTLRERINRLPAAPAAQKMQDGVQAAGEAARAAAQGEAAQAHDQASRAAEAFDAATQALDREAQAAGSQLAEQRRLRFAQHLLEWLDAQEKIGAATQAAVELLAQGTATKERGDELSQRQLQVARDVALAAHEGLAERSFTLALHDAAEQMRQSGEVLARGEFRAARSPQERAVARLHVLLEAFRQEEPSGEEPAESPQDNADAGQQNAGTPRNLLGELRLLRAWQIEIQTRTKEIQSAAERAGELTTADQMELQGLAERQGQIADLVAELNEAVLAADKK